MPSHEHQQHHPRRESGAVLIIGLVLLLALTLIGVTAMRATTLEERMAGNLRDKALAFEAAEAALRAAELEINSWIVAPIASSNTSCTSGCPEVWEKGELQPSDDIWSDARTIVVDANDLEPAGVAEPPRYFIEEVYFRKDSLNTDIITGVQFYRVTARGVGGSPNAQSILQTTFARRFN